MPSMNSGGRWVRLASVCLRMRWPSRQAFRSRMAGGLLRLGMVSMWWDMGRPYMEITIHIEAPTPATAFT